MISRGFSSGHGALVAIGIFIILIIGYFVVTGFLHQNKLSEIDNRVNDIHFSSSIQKKQCAGGGIDTSEWCTYTVNSSYATVVKDLTATGYKVQQNYTDHATLAGGQPEMTIYLRSGSNASITSLEAKILEGGKTI